MKKLKHLQALRELAIKDKDNDAVELAIIQILIDKQLKLAIIRKVGLDDVAATCDFRATLKAFLDYKKI